MKILAESEAFVHLPWAVSANVPEARMKKLQQVMTGLDKSADGKAILKAAKVTNFYSVTDSDFKKVREITEFAIGEKY